MSSFIKHIILCLMFFTLFMMVAMVVFRVEDIFDASPREYLPPSMIMPFGSIQGFNMSAIKKIHGSIQGFNMSAIKNIQRRLHAYINTWQAVQVINPDVPKEKITFSNNRKKLIKLNQSESVSWHSKCALVGNAGILLDSGCGDVIDKFEFVIRMNLAPSGGEFKRDVGSKVNLMTINQEQMERLISCTNSSYPPEWKCNNKDYTCLKKREAKYPSPRKPSHCDDLLRRMERINGSTLWFFKRLKSVYFSAMQRMLETLKPNYNLSIKFAYSPTNPMGPASRAWNVGFPSSGLAIYSAATQFCQQITMLGFYPFSQDSRNRTLRYHYYEERKMNYTTNKHGMPNEYRILTKLNRTGAINLINECR